MSPVSPPVPNSCMGPWGPIPGSQPATGRGLSATDLLRTEAVRALAPGSCEEGTGDRVAAVAASSRGQAVPRRQLTFWKEIAALCSFL